MTDAEKAKRVIKFITEGCTHIKGKWAGKQFELLPWQINDVIIPAFGTLKENGRRQYRTVYVEVPKKNGKSELASCIALYGLCADGEQGAEVYSAAGDREQASLVYYPAAQMVRNNETLSERLKIIDSRRRIIDPVSNSFYQVLSAEAFTKHGINPSVVIFDEIHAQPSRELYDVLTEGTDIARDQQLVFIITTAGVADKTTIGWEVHHYAKQVHDGIINDPTWKSIIYAAEEDEDWEDEGVWKRVNPSLDYIFDIENLRTHYKQVKENPARLNNFLRFRLNRWVGQVSRYIPMDKWDACGEPFDIEELKGRPCYAGIDLSSSIDLTAFVLVFPSRDPHEKWKIVSKFYVPEGNINERIKKDSVPYDYWIQNGLITPVPGKTQGDFSFLKRDILEASEKYKLKEIAFDPWAAGQIATTLAEEEGLPMVEHRQGFKTMSPPTKELYNWIVSGKLNHGGNEVLRWNADNLAVKVDAAENVKPEKDKSADRIDGVVALIMALGRAIQAYEKKSVYDERGLLSIGEDDEEEPEEALDEEFDEFMRGE